MRSPTRARSVGPGSGLPYVFGGVMGLGGTVSTPRMVRIHWADHCMVAPADGAVGGTRDPMHSCSADAMIVPRSLPSLAWSSGMRMRSSRCGGVHRPVGGAGAGAGVCAPSADASMREPRASRLMWWPFASGNRMFVLSCLYGIHDDGALFARYLRMDLADVVDG